METLKNSCHGGKNKDGPPAVVHQECIKPLMYIQLASFSFSYQLGWGVGWGIGNTHQD